MKLSECVTTTTLHPTVTFFIILLFTNCECKSYKNHALLRSVPYDDEQLIFFKTLEKVYNVTWWKEPTLVHNTVEFSIGPRNLATLYRDTEEMSIRFAILIRNIESAFDKQKASPYFRRNMQSFNWHSYYRLDDIYEWLKDVSINNPSEVQLRRIGTTHQNRTIIGVRLTLKGSKKRSKVIVEGGCHGREWLSPAFVTYMIYTLLNAKVYKDPELELIAYMYTWIFVPVMNPDGYEYSHTTDRLWRKNRRPGDGVDLNRNYGIAFGTLGTNPKTPSSSNYCGDYPFSEPESYSMATFTREHRHTLEYYFSIHSYGQLMILPYAHLLEHEDNYDKVKALADKAVERISANHRVKYKTGTSFETTGYLASGLSSDWVKRALNITYVLSIELPDTGVHGFALPPGRILSACQATMDGLLAILTPQSEKFLRMGESAGWQKRVFVEVFFICNLIVVIVNCKINVLW